MLRQEEGKGAAFVRGAGQTDFSAEQARDFAADRQAQAGAAGLAAGAAVGLLEGLKDDLLLVDTAVDDDVRGMLAQGLTGIRRYGEHGERRGDELAVFVNSFAPPPRMFVFGAIDFAAAVARTGKFLGYHVTVCDARPIFATRSRFPDADEVVVRLAAPVPGRRRGGRAHRDLRPHPRPEVPVPVLEVALRTPAGDIGAMGSRARMRTGLSGCAPSG